MNEIPTATIELAELYNAVDKEGRSEHDSWNKQYRNEVRHSLRSYGYSIEVVEYEFGTTTRAVLK